MLTKQENREESRIYRGECDIAVATKPLSDPAPNPEFRNSIDTQYEFGNRDIRRRYKEFEQRCRERASRGQSSLTRKDLKRFEEEKSLSYQDKLARRRAAEEHASIVGASPEQVQAMRGLAAEYGQWIVWDEMKAFPAPDLATIWGVSETSARGRCKSIRALFERYGLSEPRDVLALRLLEGIGDGEFARPLAYHKGNGTCKQVFQIAYEQITSSFKPWRHFSFSPNVPGCTIAENRFLRDYSIWREKP